MGLAMAGNVLDTGFPLVVWNRTAARCTPLVDAGARTPPRLQRSPPPMSS